MICRMHVKEQNLANFFPQNMMRGIKLQGLSLKP